MMKITGAINFADGTTRQFEAGQWAIGQLGVWALRNGFKPIPGMTWVEQLEIVGMRVIAWAADQRNASPKMSFDIWDALVDEVEFTDSDVPDPTQTAASGEPLPALPSLSE